MSAYGCFFAIIAIISFSIVLIIGSLKHAIGGESTRPNNTRYRSGPLDPNDIATYRTTMDIYKSRRFTATERKKEYIRRGKSPSGVVDGEYNDTYLDDGEIYNDENRDWDADA